MSIKIKEEVYQELVKGLDDSCKTLPNFKLVSSSISLLLKCLIPSRYYADQLETAKPFKESLETALTQLKAEMSRASATLPIEDIFNNFINYLPELKSLIEKDIRAAYDGDPAATSEVEVSLSYPGLLAIAAHRIGNFFYKHQIPIVPRMINEWAHSKTGIDIHPGATIGESFFIDHGTGVVIGETTKIGKHVKIYQGVTLGAKSFPLDENGHPLKNLQRHPIVEDDVIIYANATILGGDTVIGKGSTIGGNAFIFKSVAANSTINYR